MSRLAHQINDQLTPSSPIRSRGRRGLGDASADARAQLQKQLTKNGNDYLVSTAPDTYRQNAGQWNQLLSDVASGNFGAAAADGDQIAFATISVSEPLVGIAIGAIVEGIEWLYSNDHPDPCTIKGCGGTFGMPECDNFPDGTSPFTWSSIASQGGAPPPAPDAYGLLPGTNLKDWSDYYWLCSGSPPYKIGVNCPYGSPVPTMPGGPGSFEAGLQQAMMQQWNTHATAPWLCKAMKDAGMDGSVYFGNNGNEVAVWKMLFAYAGLLIQPFAAAWNASHDTGGSPQRKVTYGPYLYNSVPGAGSLAYGDPLNAAFFGLWMVSGLPQGATVSVMVNGGQTLSAPKIGSVLAKTGGVFRPGAATPTSSTSSTILTSVAVAAAAALVGTAAYARYKHKPYKTVWSDIWKKTGGRVHVPKHLLPKHLLSRPR